MSFVTPFFFWAGAALISIPLIIHFLNRRRFKLVHWAAMEYLLQALRKNRRRIKFEQILLLATRCAILALLGLALARPLGCAESSLASLVGSKSALHVFVPGDDFDSTVQGAAFFGLVVGYGLIRAPAFGRNARTIGIKGCFGRRGTHLKI